MFELIAAAFLVGTDPAVSCHQATQMIAAGVPAAIVIESLARVSPDPALLATCLGISDEEANRAVQVSLRRGSTDVEAEAAGSLWESPRMKRWRRRHAADPLESSRAPGARAGLQGALPTVDAAAHLRAIASRVEVIPGSSQLELVSMSGAPVEIEVAPNLVLSGGPLILDGEPLESLSVLGASLHRMAERAADLDRRIGAEPARFTHRLNLAVAPEVPASRLAAVLEMASGAGFDQVFFVVGIEGSAAGRAYLDPEFGAGLVESSGAGLERAVPAVQQHLVPWFAACPELRLALEMATQEHSELQALRLAAGVELAVERCGGTLPWDQVLTGLEFMVDASHPGRPLSGWTVLLDPASTAEPIASDLPWLDLAPRLAQRDGERWWPLLER